MWEKVGIVDATIYSTSQRQIGTRCLYKYLQAIGSLIPGVSLVVP